MSLNAYFKKFHANISLNKDRLARIESAYSNLSTFADGDGPLSAIKKSLFMQGSSAIGTAVRPIKEDAEFDADAVLSLDISQRPRDKQSPHEIVAWIAERLRNNRHFEGKVNQKDRCVRINYAGDFHLDVVPAWWKDSNESPLRVPSREDGEWKLSHPWGYIQWTEKINGLSRGRFCRVMKMLKHWRNLKFGKDSAPKSILFTTLIGERIEQGCTAGYAMDVEVLIATMEALHEYLAGYFFVPEVTNPSLKSEDLAEDWEQEHFDLFRERLASATQKARRAWELFEDDPDRSIELWRDLFGEAFPKELAEGVEKTAEAIVSGALYVTPSGRVQVGRQEGVSGVQVPKHRSFGK